MPQPPAANFAQIPDLFIASRSHRDFVLGKRRRYGSSVIMIGAAILLLVWALLITAFTLDRAARAQEVATAGIDASAAVTELRTRTNRNTVYYIVSYRFKAGERTIDHSQEVYESTYRRLAEGDVVTVRYLPADPAQAALTGEFLDTREGDVNRDTWLWFGLTAYIAAFVCLWIDLRNARRSRLGVLLPGKVMRAELKRGYRNAPYFQIEYAFYTPSGARLEGKQDTNDMRVVSTQPPPPFGTPVAVLYVNDSHYRMM